MITRFVSAAASAARGRSSATLPQQRQQPLLPRAAYYRTPCASFEPDSELASSGSSGSTSPATAVHSATAAAAAAGSGRAAAAAATAVKAAAASRATAVATTGGACRRLRWRFAAAAAAAATKRSGRLKNSAVRWRGRRPERVRRPAERRLKGAPPEAGLSNTAAAAAVLSVPPQPELFPKGGKAEGEPEQEAAGQQQQQQQQQQQRRRQAGFAAVVLPNRTCPRWRRWRAI